MADTVQDSWLETIAKGVLLPRPHTTIKETMEIMSEHKLGTLPVLNEDGSLFGIVVDGDLRRGILSGANLDSPISSIANVEPVVLTDSMSREEVLELMTSTRKSIAPVVDGNGLFLGTLHIDHLVLKETKSNPVVVFAGGFGKRLHPFTEHTPKPMLPVGGTPIVSKALDSVIDHGYNNIHMLLHYRPEAFFSYFGEKDFHGRKPNLVVEEFPRGTAGGLTLLSEHLSEPFLVLNGDNIVKADWSSVIQNHEKSGAAMTIGAAEYTFSVPFGVLQLDENRVEGVIEKPDYRFPTICSAYCMSPRALKYIPREGHFDMPDLISALIDNNERVERFNVTGYQRIEELIDSHSKIWQSITASNSRKRNQIQ